MKYGSKGTPRKVDQAIENALLKVLDKDCHDCIPPLTREIKKHLHDFIGNHIMLVTMRLKDQPDLKAAIKKFLSKFDIKF